MYKKITPLISLMLVGCASHSEIKVASNPIVPQHWHNSKSYDTAVTNESWHTIFKDSHLDSLISIALANNSQITRAGYRLQQASLASSMEQTNILPIFSSSIRGTQSQNLTNNISTQSYSTGLNVGYEIDLWKKLANAIDVKQWEALATKQDLEATKLSIEGLVVNTYFAQALVGEKIFIAKENLEKAKSVNKLISIRYRAGNASRLDLLMSEKNIMNMHSAIQSLLKEKETLSNTMALLLDKPPHGAYIYEPTRFPIINPKQPSKNIPATVLSNRPDVQAAQLRVQKAMSGIDYAKANFYPSFNLTGSLGTSGSALKDILSNPIGSLALGAVLPFLNWDINSINLSLSKVQYEDLKTVYKTTLYNALAEIENALSANDRYQKESKILFGVYQNAQNQEKLYNLRYKAGASSLKEVLDASDVTRNARLAYIQSLYNWYISRATLHLAFGGK